MASQFFFFLHTLAKDLFLLINFHHQVPKQNEFEKVKGPLDLMNVGVQKQKIPKENPI